MNKCQSIFKGDIGEMPDFIAIGREFQNVGSQGDRNPAKKDFGSHDLKLSPMCPTGRPFIRGLIYFCVPMADLGHGEEGQNGKKGGIGK